MTKLVERYRRNAERCLRLVQDFSDLEAKRSLLAMANAWLALAAQRAKNIEVALASQRIKRVLVLGARIDRWRAGLCRAAAARKRKRAKCDN